MGVTEPRDVSGDGAWRVRLRRVVRLSGRRALVTAALKFALAMSLTGIALNATYSVSVSEISPVDIRDIVLLGLAVNTLLLAAVLLLLRSKACNAALSLVVLVSVASGYLIHTDLYLTGNRALLALLSAVTLFGLFAVFEFMDENRTLSLILPSVALLVLAIVVLPHFRTPGGGRDYESQIRLISFEETPNLYFVSFDGLAPQAVTQKYLDVETTDLLDLLNAEFRHLPNMFADSIWSVFSLNTLAALDPRISWGDCYWDNCLPTEDPGYLVGTSPSPLFDILGANGYEITTIFLNPVWGASKGPFVHNYEISKSRTACDLLDPSIAKIAFWGYCNFGFANHESLGNGWYGEGYGPQMDLTARAADEQDPQFTLSYFKLPIHTLRSYNHFDPDKRAAFRDLYVQRSNLAAPLLDDLLETLRERDPEAILFVFGDHGLWLSRPHRFEDDPQFVVQDRMGVYGGIWPPDACESWFDETLEQGWLTILGAVHTILRCLSGGEEALVEPLRRTMPSGYQFFPDDGNEHSFGDYLYE